VTTAARMPRVSCFLWIVGLLVVAAGSAARGTQPADWPVTDSASSLDRERRMPAGLVPQRARPAASQAGSASVGPIPIAPPQGKPAGTDRAGARGRAGGNVASAVLGSLAIVLGVFFLVVWLARRTLPKSALNLPSDVLEILGRAPLASRHHLQLIRLGRRVLLVSVSPDSATTLAEVSDPKEVDHLAALCRQSQPESISASFRNVLQQLGTSTPRAERSEPRVRGRELGPDYPG
jgi:flagellar biogenesis protein FliO